MIIVLLCFVLVLNSIIFAASAGKKNTFCSRLQELHKSVDLVPFTEIKTILDKF